MLQDIVPGGDEELYTLGSYLDAQSRPLAQFTGHKLRQHPPRFGHVSMAVSTWVPELAEAGLRLLHELGYHGVSQVEFKRDPRDGRYRLMEVNARHWMWHSLATACGVNLSLAAYRDAIGEPYISPRQVDGLKWVVSLTDARDAFARWRRGEEKLWPWLRSYRGVRVDGLYSLRDPLPGALLTARQAQDHRDARRQAGGGGVAVRIERFLAAAGRPPAGRRLPGRATPAASTSSATSAATASRCSAFDPDPGAIGLRSRYAAGSRLPRPARRRGGLPHLARDRSGRSLPQRAVALPQPRRVHLAALAPRRSGSSRGSSCPSRAGT